MMIVTDTSDPILPIPDDLSVNLSDSQELVLNLLETFSNFFINSQSPKT
jgi:hypothetical protein